MAAGGQAPLVDLPLEAAGAGGHPGGVGQHVGQLAAQEVEHAAPGRQRVGDAEHELHVQAPGQQALLRQVGGVVEHRQVEDLDLRLDVVLEHLARQPFDEVRRVLVDVRREVHRAGGQRGHVGLQVQHRAAGRLVALPRGELARDDALALGCHRLGIGRVAAQPHLGHRSSELHRARGPADDSLPRRIGARGTVILDEDTGLDLSDLEIDVDGGSLKIDGGLDKQLDTFKPTDLRLKVSDGAAFLKQLDPSKLSSLMKAFSGGLEFLNQLKKVAEAAGHLASDIKNLQLPPELDRIVKGGPK